MLFQLLRFKGSLKILHYFLKKIADNFERENKLKNAEILSWLMGLGPIHLLTGFNESSNVVI